VRETYPVSKVSEFERLVFASQCEWWGWRRCSGSWQFYYLHFGCRLGAALGGSTTANGWVVANSDWSVTPMNENVEHSKRSFSVFRRSHLFTMQTYTMSISLALTRRYQSVRCRTVRSDL